MKKIKVEKEVESVDGGFEGKRRDLKIKSNGATNPYFQGKEITIKTPTPEETLQIKHMLIEEIQRQMREDGDR